MSSLYLEGRSPFAGSSFEHLVPREVADAALDPRIRRLLPNLAKIVAESGEEDPLRPLYERLERDRRAL